MGIIIAVSVLAVIGIVATILYYTIPGLKGKEKKQNEKDVAEENVKRIVVDPDAESEVKADEKPTDSENK